MGFWRVKTFAYMKNKICKLVKEMTIKCNAEEVIRCNGQYATILDCHFVNAEGRVSENVSESYF